MGTNSVANGNDSFCDCASVRYCIACADVAIDATTVAGTVRRTQSTIPIPSRSCGRRRSEGEADGPEHVVGVGAGWVVIDRLLIGQLEDHLGRRDDGYAGGVELHSTFAGRRVHIRAGKP